MDYRVQETSYGPDIRQHDWVLEAGEARPGGGFLHLLTGKGPARIFLAEPYLPGGGDVERIISFDVDSCKTTGVVTLYFGIYVDSIISAESRDKHGIRIFLNGNLLQIFLGGKGIFKENHPGITHEGKHTFRVVMLGAQYAVWYNERLIVEGKEDFPFNHNEGTVAIEALDMDIRLLDYCESFITIDREPPRWRRKKLLYEENFSKDSLKENWLLNYTDEKSKPLSTKKSFIFRKLSNCFISKRFEAPVAMDCTVCPVPEESIPSRVTDLIVIWLISAPERQAMKGHLEKLKSAALSTLINIPFYWVDFGGTNNVTTRLRKNPRRHLIRQFNDRKRLLKRNKTYRLTVVQNNGFVEFWVDGKPWIRQYDSDPLVSGHMGFRAFWADLEVSEIKVWKISDDSSKKLK